MKKHLSLFLALLLLFSALLAFPAEAVQPEQTKDIALTPSVHKEGEAPRATDLYAAGDSAMYVPGNDSCSHTYKIMQYSSTKHKKYCTKCGYAVYYAHNTAYKYINLTTCRKYCPDCQYVLANEPHNNTYRYYGNVCQKYCTKCKNVAGNEPHSYSSTGVQISSTQHKLTCTKCKVSIKQESHSIAYQNCGSSHVKYCTKCDYSVSEACTYGDYYNVANAKHRRDCQYCNGYQQSAHTPGAVTCIDGNESVHQRKCTVCKLNYTEAHSHEYTKIDMFDHWKKCTVCSGRKIEAHQMYCLCPPAYSIDGLLLGYGIMKCENCSYFYTYQ